MKTGFWKSRLFGPFLISFIFCFAVVDYSIYIQNYNTPLHRVWKILAAVCDFIDKLPPLSSYVPVTNLWLFGSIGLLVGLSLGAAKKAMRVLTEKVDQPRLAETYSTVEKQTPPSRGEAKKPAVVLTQADEPRLAETYSTVEKQTPSSRGKAKNPAVVITEKVKETRPQETYASEQTAADAAPVVRRSWFHWKANHFGLTGKMVATFAGVAIVFGLVTIGIVYRLSFGAFERQMNLRANDIAMNLSETVAKHALGKNLVGFRDELARIALGDDVAYIFVEDDKGNVWPPEHLSTRYGGSVLKRISTDKSWTTVLYKGFPVYETRAGILDGQLGILHLGIWQDAVENEIRNALVTIALVILAAMVAGVWIFSVAARRISLPLLQLVQRADRLSAGELDTPIGLTRSDEIGELSLSLERLRASFKAVTVRTNRARPSR